MGRFGMVGATSIFLNGPLEVFWAGNRYGPLIKTACPVTSQSCPDHKTGPSRSWSWMMGKKKNPEEGFSLSEITAGLTGEAAAVSASDLATPCAAHALLHDLLPDLVGVFCVSRKKDLRPDHS